MGVAATRHCPVPTVLTLAASCWFLTRRRGILKAAPYDEAMEPSSAALQRTGGWLPLTLTCLGTVVVLVSLAVGVIATTSWQNTYELPACPPEDVSCLGQTREVVDKNPAILLLGVVTLLLAAADVWALVQMRRHRTTRWVQVSCALLALSVLMTLSTLTAWWSFRSLTY